MKKPRSPLPAAVLAAALCSCSLLGVKPFKVLSWTPGGAYAEPGSWTAFTFTFSAPADRVSVESAVKIAEDGSPLSGFFSWEGNTLSFTPAAPLKAYADYAISIGTGASGADQMSLTRDFTARFSSRSDHGRPHVVSSSPANLSTVAGPRAPITISFDEPVPFGSFIDNCSISPALSGRWTASPDSATFSFGQLEDFENAESYLVKLSADLEDMQGNSLGDKFTLNFKAGDDVRAPLLSAVRAIAAGGGTAAAIAWDDASDGVASTTSGWESSWRLEMEFDEPIKASLMSVSNLSSNPSLSLELEPVLAPIATTFRFKLKDKPEWGKEYSFILRGGIEDERGNQNKGLMGWRIVTDGPASRPPELVGFCVPSDVPSYADETGWTWKKYELADAFSTFTLNEPYYGNDLTVATVLDVYFRLADGASLDPFSVMNAVSLSGGNSGITFSPQSVAILAPDPADQYAGQHPRARIKGNIHVDTPGEIVTFKVSSGLADSAGNATTKEIRIPLVR